MGSKVDNKKMNETLISIRILINMFDDLNAIFSFFSTGIGIKTKSQKRKQAIWLENVNKS